MALATPTMAAALFGLAMGTSTSALAKVCTLTRSSMDVTRGSRNWLMSNSVTDAP